MAAFKKDFWGGVFMVIRRIFRAATTVLLKLPELPMSNKSLACTGASFVFIYGSSGTVGGLGCSLNCSKRRPNLMNT